MGNFGSRSSRMPGKQKKRWSGPKKSGPRDARSRPPVKPLPRPRDLEKEALEELRTALDKDLKTFILDNLLLSVQFFQNFEREVNTLRSTSQTDSEANRNKQLEKQQRHCITPDRLHQLVARRVQYRPQHGDNKHVLETIHPQRLIVVQDNVEIMQGRDSGHYGDDTSEITYTLSMETASPGYVKLYTNTLPAKRRVTYDTIDSKSDDSSDDSTKTDNNDRVSLGRDSQHSQTDEETHPLHLDSDGSSTSTVISPVFNRPPLPLPTSEFIEQLHRRVEGGSVSSSGSVDEDIDTVSEIGTPTQRPAVRVFGPRSPDRESASKPRIIYTKTERKLSGIRRPHPAQRPIPPSVRLLVPLSTSLPNLSSPTRARTSPANSESSGYKSNSSLNLSLPNSRGSESDYGYSMITELRTPRPIRLRRLGKTPARSSDIPSECFKMRDIPRHEESDSDEDDKTPNDANRPRSKSKLFTTRYYLNSTDYMASFADLFIDRLFEPLGFSKDSTQSPMMQGATIHCDVIHKRDDALICKSKMNIMPAIACRSWPKEGFEWIRRPRTIVRRHNVLYQWPTQAMVNKIQSFGYNILPVGYLPTQGRNNEHQLEWQLAFPQAEAYLESCLTHAQLRCYLFTMALYKSFLEPAQKSELGLTPAHLRTALFWQCERNYADWPEYTPGVTLSAFLDCVYTSLKKEKLADYFLPQRNLYESIPVSYLRRVQEQLHRIQENLIMHVMVAVRNLRYVEGEDNFYPCLDFKRLYDIITTEDFVSILNPSLGLAMKGSKETTKKKEEESDESDREDPWKSVAVHDHKRKWTKEVRRQIEAEKAAEKLTSGPRKSTDSINLESLPITRPDPMRRKLLLELFIPHFISIARQSITHRAYKQSLMYLAHAERLNVLLQEEANSDHGMVGRFLLNIQVLKDKATAHLNPKTPPPESEEFVFVKKSMMRIPSAVDVTVKKISAAPLSKVPVPKITIAEVHSNVSETDTDKVPSAAPSANVSENENEEVEETSL
ncbi:uncharacterized protein [Anabrus simplex]|uniref:uncharacterized protein n=1 Tax=Anabrus simplex TaxID=316456 RepID=UPI0035A2E4C0